ncbi:MULTISPECIES: triose-phosphate isomerase [unclassified Pseudomonas]|uniref:triose-phosphate isomerase n=1 Tax=unclassified Pseudomonas TaxID=196821 RepID=UPI00257F494E|nr:MULTISPECIES: triose-phosphate isomerase [unclassified Pseudomonas]
MRKPLVAGNWKMHGTRADVAELIEGLSKLALSDEVEMVVFPPFLFIDQVEVGLADSSIGLGAQDCAVQPEQGALTGEISASQLRDVGCEYVLVGHSERRLILLEDDDTVAKKFASAQKMGIVPVLCVGETREQREAGKTFDVVKGQLKSVIDVLGVEAFESAVVAYEPVWAIGTGLTATPDEAQAVHQELRQFIRSYSSVVADKVRLLYGGSVKGGNAAELFGMPDIDGGLVGGASLNANEFGVIYHAAGSK